MRYFTFLLLFVSSLAIGQLEGNWHAEPRILDVGKDTFSLNLRRSIAIDTSSLFSFQAEGKLVYNPIIIEKQDGNAVSTKTSIFRYTDARYLTYGDTLQLIFFNKYFPLTDGEIRKASKKELKNHYIEFGKSQILHFKFIKVSDEKILLIRV